MRGGLTGVLGPVFLLSPVALFALRRREGRQLLLAAADQYPAIVSVSFTLSPWPSTVMSMRIGWPALLWNTLSDPRV